MYMAYVFVTCSGCGKEFARLVKGLKGKGGRPITRFYCGYACRRKRVERACERCGAAFGVFASALDTRPSRWCSRTCADIGRKRGETRTCQRCGAAFYLHPSALKNPGRTGLWCSDACKGPAISAALSGRKHTTEHGARTSAAKIGKPILARRRPLIVKQCWQCEGPFEVPRKRTVAYRAAVRFCGTACWYAFARLHPEETPSYRGGFEPYYGPNWPEQARLARKRDGATCQDCGKHQTRPALDVHHLVPRRAFSGDYVAANRLENLVSLCKSCHSAREQVLTKILTA